MMIKVIAATRNQAKIAELSRLIGDRVEIVPLPVELASHAEPPEGEESIAENAIAKAVWWSREIDGGQIVIATDGGLEIPALREAWNPARTKRFAGAYKTDLERAEAVIRRTAHLKGDERRIDWFEAVALAVDGESIELFIGRGADGILAADVDAAGVEAGGGFWIPAIWICPEFGGRRLSSLTDSERESRDDHWNEIAGPLRAFLALRIENGSPRLNAR